MERRHYEERDLLWLAGWLEGEGSFIAGFRRANGWMSNPYIVGSCTDRDVILRVCKIMRCTIAGPFESAILMKDGRRRKPKWIARLSGWPSVDLMRRLYPHMGERRQRAILRAIYSVGDWKAREAQRATGKTRGSNAELVRALHAQGCGWQEIADRLPIKITMQGVRYWCRRNGLRSNFVNRWHRASDAA